MQPPGIPDPVELRTMPETKGWPEAVFAALSRALTRDPGARTANVEQFATEFAQAVTQWETGDGTPEPWEGRLGTPSQVIPQQAKPARRLGAFAAGGVLLAVVVGVGFWLRSRPEPSPAPAAPASVPPAPVPQASPESLPSQVPPPVPPSSVFNEADTVAMLDRLTDPARVTDQSAEQAVAAFRRLLPRFTTPGSRGAAGFFAGRALVHLGRETEACGIFKAAVQDVRGTALAEPVRAVLEGCR